MELTELAMILNREFNAPFLPEGFVRARVADSVMLLKIGKRDVRFDDDGVILGAGTEIENIAEEANHAEQ